jgi:23S rRNA (pseudouridine1915-N3)-methyltransferase
MITIIAVGQKQPDWVNAAFEDYASRLSGQWEINLKEVKAEPRTSGKTVQAMKLAEAERIRVALPRQSPRILALDEHGKAQTTQQFAALLEAETSQHQQLAFLIGGPDGHDETLKQQSHHVLRLSDMTLPHGLARVLLAEQIYRAWSLLNNHPYHRA